jgi:uncharacterized protein with HEPN domain
VSRSPHERLADVIAAIDRTVAYRPHLENPDEAVASMAYDAVLRNLAVIGEAVRALPDEVKARVAEVPWASITGLRNVVVHESFRVDRAVIEDVVDRDLCRTPRRHQDPPARNRVERLGTRPRTDDQEVVNAPPSAGRRPHRP